MELTKEHFRAYIFIEQRRGLSAKQTSRQLHEANCKNSPSESTVHRWCSKLRQERSSLADDPRSGRPNFIITEEQIEAVKQRTEENPKISLRILSDDLGLSKDSTRRILINHLGKRKVCSVWVPHIIIANGTSKTESSVRDASSLWWKKIRLRMSKDTG